MKLFGIILFLTGGLLGARTTNAASVVISSDYINRLMAEARTNNPSLKAADSRVRAATLNADAVRSWEDPAFMVGGSTFSARGMNPAQQGDLAYGVEQKLPLWGRPQLMRRVADAEASVRRADSYYRLQELHRDIARELLEAALAERVVEIGEQDLSWLNATVQEVETKYRDGQASLADTLQVQNELAERNDRLHTDRHLAEHEHFNLNRLLNRPEDSPWPPLRLPEAAPAIPFSAKLLSLALANEPELKVMTQEIKQAQANAELTRRSRLPDVSLDVEGREYSGDGGFREGDFTVRFSLPWFNDSNYRKDYDRDRAKQESAEEEREDQAWMVREKLHHLAVEIDASRREALLYSGEITTRASQALSSRLSDWENGHGLFRDVLDARRMLLDSELMSARAVAEENEMIADLLLWSGLQNMEDLAPLANEPSLLSNHEH
jgi:cobalt-zinc-cadmium efflux system outer membrane protein